MTRVGTPKVIVAALAVMSAVGVIGLASLAAEGAEPRWRWGYVAATLAFVLSAAQLAPALALTSRLGRGFWGAPLRRMADVLATSGVVTAPALILVLTQLPTWRGRPSIWFDWPGAPIAWDAVAVIGMPVAGLGLVWLGTWPERGGQRWGGTPAGWRILTRGLIVLGALYTMLAVFVHLLVASDLAMSLVPSWHSAVIPAYQVVSGFEAAVALVVVSLAALRQLDQRVARACARLLLALALLWFYLVWCELLTYWYGRTPDEQQLLALFMFGPGAPLFVVSVLCEFLTPLLVLMWNAARNSASATTLVALIVVIGSYFDRLRTYLPAWTVSTPTPTAHLPEILPPLPPPGLAEIVACAGLLAFVGLVVILVLARVPAVAEWEVKAVERLTPRRRMLRATVRVVARPS